MKIGNIKEKRKISFYTSFLSSFLLSKLYIPHTNYILFDLLSYPIFIFKCPLYRKKNRQKHYNHSQSLLILPITTLKPFFQHISTSLRLQFILYLPLSLLSFKTSEISKGESFCIEKSLSISLLILIIVLLIPVH